MVPRRRRTGARTGRPGLRRLLHKKSTGRRHHTGPSVARVAAGVGSASAPEGGCSTGSRAADPYAAQSHDTERVWLMLTRFVRIQLVIFTVASLVGVAVMGLRYVQLPTLLGIGRITVTLDLPATGGL